MASWRDPKEKDFRLPSAKIPADSGGSAKDGAAASSNPNAKRALVYLLSILAGLSLLLSACALVSVITLVRQTAHLNAQILELDRKMQAVSGEVAEIRRRQSELTARQDALEARIAKHVEPDLNTLWQKWGKGSEWSTLPSRGQ